MDALKRILINKKSTFEKLCESNHIQLDYVLNREGISILSDIFQKREYADYFPFYEDSVILDFGGHFGYFSLFAWKNSGNASRIFVFEPDPKNFQILSKNIENTPIVAFQMGVSETTGTAKLFLGNSTNHSLIHDYKLNLNAKEFVTIETISLKDIFEKNNLEKVDFVKMDCEGAEYEIILNSPSEVLQKISTFSIEFHDMQIKEKTAARLIEKLMQSGFKVVKYVYEPSNLGLNYGKLIMTQLF